MVVDVVVEVAVVGVDEDMQAYAGLKFIAVNFGANHACHISSVT